MTRSEAVSPSIFPKLQVVIVGFGHAGKIHHRALQSLADICTVCAVVEPNPAVTTELLESAAGMKVFRDLEEALQVLGGDVIIDFCVPAKVNLSLVETALTFGVRRFLIEKPLGWDVASTVALVSRLEQCDVVYLDTYASSTGLQQLLNVIAEQDSNPVRVDVRFHKNRLLDSISDRGFVHGAVPNAWMIEGPHMLSICRQIAGEITQITQATTFDMRTGVGGVLPEHGGGQARLEHENGTVTCLDLDMCSEQNERRVEVELQNSVGIALTLPRSKTTEQQSTVEVSYPDDRWDAVQIADRPMEYCVQNAIYHFAGEDVTVSSLSDGLAVCEIVEQMTEKKQFWQSAPKLWKHFGPPLRPCPEDIAIMENQVNQWMGRSAASECKVLLCGVTPEIVNMNWPPGTRLWAVEKSQNMIEEVWPAGKSQSKQPIQAEWTHLPFAADSFDIIIGDGCFTSLEYPGLQMRFLESLNSVLRRGGLLMMRFFVQKVEPEQPGDVFDDLLGNRIGSFHAMKWRLAMSLQDSARKGVKVDDIWQAWHTAAISTSWPAEAISTIDTYKGSDHRLIFTNLGEVRDLFAASFEEVECIEPGYELGDRCPILVFSPKQNKSEK